MVIPRRHLRLGVGTLFTFALAAGCQDQQALTLGSSESNDPRSIAARLLAAETCQELPNKQVALRDMVKAVNAERARQRVAPVHVNDTLAQIADFYACRLVDGDFFDHVDPFYGSTLDSRATDFGYAFLKIGENLAAGQTSVDKTIADWMNSLAHRAVLLDPAFTEIGVSVRTGGAGGPYWVQEFGRPVTAGDESAPTASQPCIDPFVKTGPSTKAPGLGSDH